MDEETTDQVKEAEESQARLSESIESCKRIVRSYRKLMIPDAIPEDANAELS